MTKCRLLLIPKCIYLTHHSRAKFKSARSVPLDLLLQGEDVEVLHAPILHGSEQAPERHGQRNSGGAKGKSYPLGVQARTAEAHGMDTDGSEVWPCQKTPPDLLESEACA